MNKPKIIKSYENLSDELLEQIKLTYPRGFWRHLISFSDAKGVRQKGLPFETEDKSYLIKMSRARAKNIIAEDDDFDDDGNLKTKVKEKYIDNQDGLEFLDSNTNTDNMFSLES
ncbi:hypothetical protein [Aureispira anguillae]|uniref:Uncharacterized protein n=1 Tax=Aureispira anguillae TaxID=2864201 RepID=A0A915YBX3_9BACT|nr:hypothetical protein [Aureispira anguillae]BDS10231.1 hypothetical protein AsAng_0009390 [Aureispira anguillae]